MEIGKIYISFNDNRSGVADLIAELLRQYQKVIASSIGSINGNFKFICGQVNTENLMITNTSRHLINCFYNIEHLKADNEEALSKFGFVKWQFDMIKLVMQTVHFDHNYDAGLFTCHIINEFLIYFNKENSSSELDDLFKKSKPEFGFNKSITDYLFKSLIDNFINLKQRSSKSSLVSVKLDLNNLNYVRKLIKTVLNSKCIIEQLDERSKENFLNLCLQAFIKSFRSTEKKTYFASIIYLFSESMSLSLNETQRHDGVLFQLDKQQAEEEFNQKLLEKKTESKFKCILFDTNAFSGDFELMENLEFSLKIESSSEDTRFAMVDSLIESCKILISKHNIDIFLCQKVK